MDKYHIDIRKIKSIMALNGYNIGELATAAGVSRSTLSNVFKGAKPSVGTIEKIASALKLSRQDCSNIFFAADLRIAQD